MARGKSNLNRTVATRNIPGPIQGKIDSLIQGVSQQPKHLRAVGQGEEQINGWSSPFEGLTKRNPNRLVSKIHDTPIPDFYMEVMQAAPGERYSVMLNPEGGNTKITIMREGVPATLQCHGTGISSVGVSGSTGYLYNAAGSYPNKYVLINNGPLGLLLNREKVTALSSDTTPAQQKDALVFVQAVAYELSYVITLDGQQLSAYTTPKASDTNNTISTSIVATELAAKINAVSGYTATVDRYIVKVARTDGADFTMKIDDNRGNSFARIVKGSVTSLAELPVLAPNGFIINVSSEPGSTRDDRWLKFVTFDGAAIGDGTWGEVAKPGVKFRLDENTMPYIVYRADVDVFFVGPADGSTQTQTVNGKPYSYTFPKWGQRTAGDETTAPDPAFIGKTIRDHVLFRGRYVLSSGQNVVFSEVNQIFNFYQDTSIALLASDGFSVLATGEVSSELNWVLPVDEYMLVFSQYSQFRISAANGDVLTPETAVILRMSNLEMNPYIRPRLAGPQILFGTNEFGYSHFREYGLNDFGNRRSGLNLGSSNDVCSNIPKYIEGLATVWDVGESTDVAAMITPTDTKTLFVYKYLFQAAAQQSLSKTQSSWSKFRFNGDVRWVKFIDGEMWTVLTYPDGTYMTRVILDELEIPAAPQVYLDRLLLYPDCNSDPSGSNNVSASYDASTNKTTFTLPYQTVGKCNAVIRYSNDLHEGLLLGSMTSGNTLTCEADGDWRNTKVAFGEEYLFSYEFTTGYVPSPDQGRNRVVGKLDGRTQLLTFTAYHLNTGRYTMRVERAGRANNAEYEFRARHINTANNRLDTETSHLETGAYRVPIYCENTACRIFVESNSWLPVTITGATWEGSYSNRARGN